MNSRPHRASGILLHPTSLPGPFGIGTLGSAALNFVDQLAAAGQSVWQVLPLGPTGWGDSPYTTFSAFAGNPLLIDLPALVDVGDLLPGDLPAPIPLTGRTDYPFAAKTLQALLPVAAERFFRAGSGRRHEAFELFCVEQAYWLNDYALFRAARRHFGHRSWPAWPAGLRDREPDELRQWGSELVGPIRLEKYTQFLFFEQWWQLKHYANRQGIYILGDMPIFVAHDSSDVWCNRALFLLDRTGEPTVVAGVPPDYFSRTGQRWGNPLYDWQAMEEQKFGWWVARVAWALKLCDRLRIDHFRGFSACWEIPASEPTAINGRWTPVPGDRLFRVLLDRLGPLPLIAEDLGVITEDVTALRDRWQFPGMRILQFAFDGTATNPYLPHNYRPETVVYTGTHDNDTTCGWWAGLPAEQRLTVHNYLGQSAVDIPWQLIRLAVASVAELCVFPLQDILSLGSDARMNVPGEPNGNWSWQLSSERLPDDPITRLVEITRTFGRFRGLLPEADSA